MQIIKESVFKGSIRSFFTSFAAVIGISIAAMLTITFFVTIFSSSSLLPPKPETLIAPNASGERKILPINTPAILLLRISGVIGVGELLEENIRNILEESRSGMLAGNRVKGVLLYMTTPGGTVTDSDAIYRAVLEYKNKYQVPVFVYVNGICASGGMYISCAADKIYADPTSVIGSIGVISGPAFNVSDAMTKIGVSALTITQGKDKDALSPFRPWKEGEDASIRDITKALYDQFVSIVVNSRNIDKEKLVNEYGAHVFIARKAEELGYIDYSDSSYSQALRGLLKAAEIPEDQKYQVIELKIRHTLFEDLNYKALSGKITHTIDLGDNLAPELNGKFLYLYRP